MSIEEIQAAIETLVLAREALHTAGAGRAELEANRREIARLERQASYALIAEHRRAA